MHYNSITAFIDKFHWESIYVLTSDGFLSVRDLNKGGDIGAGEVA